jgi:hypothetical protein
MASRYLDTYPEIILPDFRVSYVQGHGNVIGAPVDPVRLAPSKGAWRNAGLSIRTTDLVPPSAHV